MRSAKWPAWTCGPTAAARSNGCWRRPGGVEAAKLPVEDQGRALREQALPQARDRSFLAQTFIFPKIEKLTTDLARGQLRSQAELRCTVVAVAAERYRLARGSWPASPA